MYLRRPIAQGSAGRVRLPPAVGARQPAAELRGVGSARRRSWSTSRPRPGPYELQKARRRGRRAGDPADRPDGSADRGAAGQGPGRRSAGRDPRRAPARSERVLVTTLTKRMAEDLTQYYQELGVKVRYLHSDIDTLERVEILRDLRRGVFDVLVGINLLREGLDLPEVSLVAILDADKEGFLRSGGALIQTSGRAARNVNGRVIMYADTMTDSMRTAISETARRRARAGGLQRGARHHPDQHRQGDRRRADRASTSATTARRRSAERGRRSGRRPSSTRTSPALEQRDEGGGRQPRLREGRGAARSDSRAAKTRDLGLRPGRARERGRAGVIEWVEDGAARGAGVRPPGRRDGARRRSAGRSTATTWSSRSTSSASGR